MILFLLINGFIDGNYQRTLEIRLSGAESRIGKKREDMPWIETKFDSEFKQWIMDFSLNQLPDIYQMLEIYKDKTIIIFKLMREADAYLRKLFKKLKLI